MEFGLAQGLAVDLQYDKRIQDARWQEQQYKRAQAENMAELKAFEDDLDYMNASNAFDHKLIKDDADKTIREIGEIVRNNQDWRYNPEVRRQINEKKKYLKSNQNVIRGMASDAEYKKLLADMGEIAKNPAMYDTEAYNNVMNQWKNYEAFGNQNGREAALKEGFKPFVYQKPAEFIDLPKAALDLGSKYSSNIYSTDGNGGHMQLIDEKTLRPIAEGLYRQRQRQFQSQFGIQNDVEGIKKAEDLIKAGIKLERKFAEPNHALIAKQWEYKMKQMEGAGASGQPLDAYNATFRDATSSAPGAKSITDMIGVTPRATIYDANNIAIKEEAGREFVPIGTYTQSDNVTKGRKGFQKTGDKLGVIHGYSVYSKKEIEDLGWLDDPKMKVKIEERNLPEKKEPVYYVKAQHIFDPMKNQAYAFKFNNAVGETTKQISEMGAVGNVPQVSVEEDIYGNVFDARTKQFLYNNKNR
jgi:hypothetical protein